MQKLFLLLLVFSSSFIYSNDLHNESKLKDFSTGFNTLSGLDDFSEDYLIKNYVQNPKVDSLIAKASSIFNKLETNGSYVDVLGSDDMISLPIGVKKKSRRINHSLRY